MRQTKTMLENTEYRTGGHRHTGYQHNEHRIRRKSYAISKFNESDTGDISVINQLDALTAFICMPMKIRSYKTQNYKTKGVNYHDRRRIR